MPCRFSSTTSRCVLHWSEAREKDGFAEMRALDICVCPSCRFRALKRGGNRCTALGWLGCEGHRPRNRKSPRLRIRAMIDFTRGSPAFGS